MGSSWNGFRIKYVVPEDHSDYSVEPRLAGKVCMGVQTVQRLLYNPSETQWETDLIVTLVVHLKTTRGTWKVF